MSFATQTALITLSTLALSACVPSIVVGDNPQDDTPATTASDLTTGTSTVGETPTTTVTTTTGSTSSPTDGTTAGDTTTVDPNCPMDQAHLEPLWATKVNSDGDLEMLTGPFGSLSDGRLVVTTYAATLGKLWWFSGDGEVLGSSTAMGELSLSLMQYSARVAPDDAVIALGLDTNMEDSSDLFVSRTPPNGPAPTPVALKTKLNRFADFRPHGDAVVIIGPLLATGRPFLLRADIATGATIWERILADVEVQGELGHAVALGPGDDIIAGYGFGNNSKPPVYKIWRLDEAGALVWQADLLTPALEIGQLVELVVTPDGTVLAVTQHGLPEPRVSVTALAADDGAELWTTEIAVTDENGPPVVEEGLVLRDALVVPIGRVPDYFSHFEPGPLTAELVRLSFTGDVLETAPLPLDGLNFGNPSFNVARGPCDTLLLFHADPARPWLYAFAP